MSFAPSETVENYEILGVIDKPKSGITYKVRNLDTGEFEVLRALAGSSSADPESRERFLREIRVHTRLAHPNIAAFHDVVELEGQLVMTSEYVEGRTLAERCKDGPLLSNDALHEICEVLSALEEAHALRIVHRGITAEHVILTAQGFVKLGGFGLAKPSTDVQLTQIGSVIGDPRYISPEQVTGVEHLDGRADLYSVGVLLYQALTGKVPFRSSNDFDILVAHVGTPPAPPSDLNPGISPALDRIVLKALAKRPEDRFASAREFRMALESEMNVAPAAPSAPASDDMSQYAALPRLAVPPVVARDSNLVLVAGIALGVVALIVIIAWVMN
jgi:serine/threonine-protein kinase